MPAAHDLRHLRAVEPMRAEPRLTHRLRQQGLRVPTGGAFVAHACHQHDLLGAATAPVAPDHPELPVGRVQSLIETIAVLSIEPFRQ